MGKNISDEHKRRIGDSNKRNKKMMEKKYPFFCTVEKIRENKRSAFHAERRRL